MCMSQKKFPETPRAVAQALTIIIRTRARAHDSCRFSRIHLMRVISPCIPALESLHYGD